MGKMTPTRPLGEHFPLDTLGPLLARYKPPAGKFSPHGSWTHTYGLYTLTGRGRRAGRLELKRAVGLHGAARLDVRYDRNLSGGFQRTTGRIHTRGGDELSQPSKWSFQTQLLDVARKPIACTKQAKIGTIRSGRLCISSPLSRTETRLVGRCAMNWGLFDAVQRLPGEKTKLPPFTLIDHFDQIKPDYSLSYRKTIDVAVGKATLRLTAYDQLGSGNVPWVYWVGPRGRLLLVVAGLEAYMLETSQQARPPAPT